MFDSNKEKLLAYQNEYNRTHNFGRRKHGKKKIEEQIEKKQKEKSKEKMCVRTNRAVNSRLTDITP